jgi:hypothetical protein
MLCLGSYISHFHVNIDNKLGLSCAKPTFQTKLSYLSPAEAGAWQFPSQAQA